MGLKMENIGRERCAGWDVGGIADEEEGGV